VRSATSMIKKAVLLALKEGILLPADLYGLDDEGFYAKLRAIAYPPFALVDAVFEGRIYAPVLDLPFSEANPRHRSILDLGARLELERALAGEAKVDMLDLVIDLPEGVSFETELPVLSDYAGEASLSSKPFSQSATVFTPPVVAGFARALRRVRVFARESSTRLEAAALGLLG
jgi:hypothetical protein